MGTPVSTGNRGVLALAESLVRLCREAVPGTEVVLLGSDRTGKPVTMSPEGAPLEIPLVRWRLSPKAGPRENLFWIALMAFAYRVLPFASVRKKLGEISPWIRAVEQAVLVGDIRGGDSFSDIYGIKRFLIATIPVWTVIAIRGSIVQFPQTYGPYKSWLARSIAKYLLLRSTPIIARDKRSRKVAQELVGGRKEVLLSPDVAFALHVRSPALPVQTDPPLAGAIPAGTIGLNVNGLMYNGGYNRRNMFGLALDYPKFLPELVEALLARHPGELLLVPHTFAPAGDSESDNAACVQLRDALPEALRERVRVVTAEYDCHEIKAVIGMCDFFIGSRMHSCIGALSQGLPCIGVAYSMKFAGVFESVGMGDWVVDARELDGPAAIKKCLDLFDRRDATRANLKADALNAREELKRVFARIVTDEHTPTAAAAASPDSAVPEQR